MGPRRGISFGAVVVVVARWVLRIDVEFEIAKMVGFRGLSARPNIEVCFVFLVGETGAASPGKSC